MLSNAYNVAFRRDVTILVKKSFNKTIDVEFGVFKDGKMSINLMPSDGNVDWKINFDFVSRKVRPSYAKLTSKTKIHKGFYKEWMKNRDVFFNIIKDDPKLIKALTTKGLYCVGRSKGASEALIIALDIVRNFEVDKESVFVGAFEAAKTGNKEFCKALEKYINPNHIYTVIYSRDLITKIPPFPGYYNPGVQIRVGDSSFPLPLVDHALGCFKEEELMIFAEMYDTKYADSGVMKVRLKRKI